MDRLSRRTLVATGFSLALLILVVIAGISYLSITGFASRARMVEHTQRVLAVTEQILSDLKDGETGQRGFLITGRESFLEPYQHGLRQVPQHIAELRRMTADNAVQQARIATLEGLIADKLTEMQETIALRKAQGRSGEAEQSVRIARGQALMDRIRETLATIRGDAAQRLQARSQESERSRNTAIAWIVAGNVVSFTILVLAFNLLRREVNQRERAQRAAQDAARETEDLYNHAPCGYHSLDSDGNFLRINDTELTWLGYSRDEVVGKLNFSDILAPQSVPVFEESFRRFKEVGSTVNREYEYQRKDGSTFSISLNATAVQDGAGRYLTSRSTVFDITEIKAAQQKLREAHAYLDSIFENIPSMIVVKDAQSLRFMRVNRAAEELLGLSRETLIGKTDLDIFPPEQAESFVATDHALVASGAPVDIPERTVTTHAGTRITRTRRVVIYDDSGRPRNVLGISDDVTESKKAGERIQRLNRELHERAIQLEQANKELESFSYSVSHDLRAPLRAIDGFSRLLEEDYLGVLDDEGRRLLAVIRNNSRRMGQLIDDLLAFSRLGRKPLAASKVDMDALVANVLEDLQVVGQETKFEISPLPPAWCDGTLLLQVWINLLSNAIKFSATHPNPTVRISGRRDHTEVIFSVSDNGVGFDMKYYDKLFGVFQRLHSAEEFPGTGVGLAIVQRVVQRSGGKAWAESVAGQGATFHFSLPTGETT